MPTLPHLPPLRVGCVDVACAKIQDWLPLRAELESVLSLPERERMGRFRFEQDRDRYLVQAGLAREVLASHVGCRPGQLQFRFSPRGKPAVADPVSRPPIHFNTSHSADLILLAVALEVEVGIDLEVVRAVPEMEAIVERHFCRSEAAAFAGLSSADQIALFHRFWTAKEAVLKATGDGIGELLGEVEVEPLPEGPLRLVRVPAGRPAAPTWSLVALEPAPGYVGTLAVPRRPIQVVTRWLRPAE